MTDIHDDVEKFWTDNSKSRRTYAHYANELGHDVWCQVGRTAFNKFTSFVEITPEMRVLDYGCGGGAITIPLLKAGCEVYSADISRDALNETISAASRHGLSEGLRPVKLDVRDPAQTIGAGRPYDAIITTAVFQHFPSREYSGLILGLFSQVSHKGTQAVVQMREDTGSEQFQPKTGDYRSQAITYTSHTKEDFNLRCQLASWRVARTEPGPYNYLWWFLE